jgi:hypothetical protein
VRFGSTIRTASSRGLGGSTPNGLSLLVFEMGLPRAGKDRQFGLRLCQRSRERGKSLL